MVEKLRKLEPAARFRLEKGDTIVRISVITQGHVDIYGAK